MKSAKGVPSSFATTKTFENGVALTLLSVTVFFWSPALDAFNYPKSAVLSISTTSLFVLVLPKLIQTFKPNRNQWIHLLPTLYLIWLFAGALFHGVHKTEILWGVFSRANGLITSASFLILTILLTLNVSKTLLLRILYAALSALTLITIYGFIQLAGKDPVNWVNPYNQIISTFGNPNFSSAAFVVLSLACLALVVDRETSAFLRIFTGLLIVSSLFLSYKSQSLQGIVSFLAAIQVYFVTKLFLRKLGLKRKFLFLAPLIPINAVVLFGLLNYGPLKNLIYQYTLSVREHYWRVALSMMRDYPIFGVGHDSYGLYYQRYREVGFVKQYGPSLLTNNAHNTFLQSGATTGIVSTIFLILIAVAVIIRFIRNVGKFEGRVRELYLAFFAAWCAYLLQSLVSIEQIGIAIWGWALTGILLGFPDILNHREANQFLWHRKDLSATLLYSLIILCLLLPGSSFVRQDLKLREALNQPSVPDNMVSNELRGKRIQEAISPLISLQDYSNFAIRNLFQVGPANLGVEIARQSLEKNPRSYVSLQLLTSAYKQFGDNQSAMQAYEAMSELDPNNYFDLLQYASLCVQVGEPVKARKLLERVVEIGNEEASQTARNLLKEID